MNANVKCKYAELKYEQLLSEKYFIETCFSKKFDSYSSKQKLRDMFMEIKFGSGEIIPINEKNTKLHR